LQSDAGGSRSIARESELSSLNHRDLTAEAFFFTRSLEPDLYFKIPASNQIPTIEIFT
jgi:hypothetical protein